MVCTGITHYLCYCAPPRVLAANSKSGVHVAPRELRIIPVDALLLALYCARLPPIPDAKPSIELLRKEQPKGSDGRYIMRLPTLFITVPDPLSMPMLLQYFETQDAATLLCNSLGIGLPSILTSAAQRWSSVQWPHFIAHSCLPTHIAERMRWHLGIWSNCRVLGVEDVRLRAQLYATWLILMQARRLQMLWHDPGTIPAPRLNIPRKPGIHVVHEYGVPPPRTIIFTYPLEKSAAWNRYFEGIEPTSRSYLC